MKLTKLQKRIIYEIKKVNEEYAGQNKTLALRLTTLIKRLGYSNSIIAAIVKNRIRKSAKDLSDKNLINITFKSPDFYNPGEEYNGEAYGLIKSNIDKIKEQFIKPNYFFNRILGILLNILITVVIIALFFLVYFVLNNRFENIANRIKNFFNNENVNRVLQIISNLLFICGVPFTVVTYITKNRNKSNT